MTRLSDVFHIANNDALRFFHNLTFLLHVNWKPLKISSPHSFQSLEYQLTTAQTCCLQTLQCIQAQQNFHLWYLAIMSFILLESEMNIKYEYQKSI